MVWRHDLRRGGAIGLKVLQLAAIVVGNRNDKSLLFDSSSYSSSEPSLPYLWVVQCARDEDVLGTYVYNHPIMRRVSNLRGKYCQ